VKYPTMPTWVWVVAGVVVAALVFYALRSH